MTTAFQPNAFQSDGFQIEGGVTGEAIVIGINGTQEGDSGLLTVVVQVQSDAVTGGWPTYYPRRKRKEPEPETATAQAPEQSVEDRLAQRRALRDAERRDQAITAQLKAIYAEQDALALTVMQVEAAQQFQAQEAEDLALILSLAS